MPDKTKANSSGWPSEIHIQLGVGGVELIAILSGIEKVGYLQGN